MSTAEGTRKHTISQVLTVGPKEVTRVVTVEDPSGSSSGGVNTETRSVADFLAALGERAPLDTGLLPPGVLAVRQAGNHLQLVLTTPPAINLVIWGEYERDTNAKQYLLAQPWRIIIADHLHGQFSGARVFYSPVPIYRLDQPLYHSNLPNENHLGYGGTGVGWVCLYHRDDQTGWSIAQRAGRAFERCSGQEAYNDANMSETDGPRFYRDQGKPDYTWDPLAWERKSTAEGVDWTLDSKLWIPVKVKGIDNQEAHAPRGVPLTLAMAMTGAVRSYYTDIEQPKLTNHWDEDKAFRSIVIDSFTHAVPKVVPVAPVDDEVEDDEDQTEVDGFICVCCNDWSAWTADYHGIWWDGEGAMCVGCTQASRACALCGRYASDAEVVTLVHFVSILGKLVEMGLCPDCAQSSISTHGSRGCHSCNKLYEVDCIPVAFGANAYYCRGCAVDLDVWCVVCQKPFFAGDTFVCPPCRGAPLTLEDIEP